ncbi:MAG: nucleotide exchange factor GrpE [bacterium]|nr:nucleotide exchange factor GrpE [bacterium]
MSDNQEDNQERLMGDYVRCFEDFAESPLGPMESRMPLYRVEELRKQLTPQNLVVAAKRAVLQLLGKQFFEAALVAANYVSEVYEDPDVMRAAAGAFSEFGSRGCETDNGLIEEFKKKFKIAGNLGNLDKVPKPPLPEQSQEPRVEKEEYSKKAEEYLNSWKRCAADFENYKKRRIKEDQELAAYAKQYVVEQLWPSLETLRHALKHAPADEQYRLWSKGMDNAMAQYIKALKELGVEIIATDGEKFDHQVHEAVELVATEGRKSGEVVEEVAAGYRLNGKVVRAAKVKVAK